MSVAVLQHLFANGVKVYTVPLWPEGLMMAKFALEEVLSSNLFQVEEHIDYVSLQYKAGGERKLLLKNMPYNKITGDPWKHLHQDITEAKSAYIANDTLQMLRVFYNWLIEPKQHNDPKMRDVENPISDALSTPTKGPIKLKIVFFPIFFLAGPTCFIAA